MAELIQKLREKCEKYLRHQIRGKSASVGEMLDMGRRALQPLTGYVFDPAKRTTGRVDRFCTVRFDTNNYSVPDAYCGKEVAVKAGPETVDIFCNGEVIASHRRCFERKRNVYGPKHYLPFLEKKGRAIFYAKPVQDNLPACFLDWPAAQKLSPKELTELLYLCLEKSCDTVMTEASSHTAPAQIEDTILVQAVDLRAYDAFLDRKVGTAG